MEKAKIIEFTNECCDCASGLYPCKGDRCELRHVPHYYCDKCEQEETLYLFDDMELCIDCIKERLDIVKGSEL